jgi:predicted ATPase/class 3 adenylate cyclase
MVPTADDRLASVPMAGETTRATTFLLTDIAGSTRLLTKVGSRYPAMVETHRRIIAEAVERHGGTVVPAEGDACLATFDTAPAAVVAAVGVQRALAAHDWGDEALRVRAGVHTGEALIHHGEPFGLDLHRAARIAAAAHGGQILVSSATRARLSGALPPQVSLHDVGVHRLKDLEAPVRLFQVIDPHLPASFPSPRALRADANNLPTPRTPLVGRRAELAAVTDLVRRHRMVTVTGPGGIGKTRLAQQSAITLAPEFPDGVWLVELLRASDAAEVPGLVARTLGVTTTGSAAPVAVVADALRDRSVLVVLDNFEHVIDAASVVSDLLDAVADLHVLATSRERLLLTDERVVALRPLDVDRTDGVADTDGPAAAVQLFVERAGAQQPGFTPTADDLRPITEICRLVDGLPLAIELAAAQVRVLPVRAIRERMARRLDALTGGPRDLPARHRSLRDTIAWSVKLLSEHERQLFARLSVFRGGRTLEAVTAVCGEGLGGDPLAGLAALADKSLVRRRLGGDGDVTFDMLEVVHEFASEVLTASGEREAVSRAHARYFVTVAERADEGLFGAEAHLWDAALRRQLDNIRGALRWAFSGGDVALGVRLTAALHLYWFWGGPHDDGRQWIARALEEADEDDAFTRGRLHLAQGFFAYGDGDTVEARRRMQLAVDAFAASGHERRRTWAQGIVALTYAGDRDHYEHALQLSAEAVSRARADGARSRGVGDMLAMRGEIARAGGDDILAARCYREALEIMEGLDAAAHAARLRANLAWIAVHDGDHARARQLMRDAIETYGKQNERVGVAQLIGELAAPESGLGRHERAARLLGASEAALGRLHAVREPTDQREIDGLVGRLRNVLGPRRLERLRREGAGLSFDRAVDLALGG